MNGIPTSVKDQAPILHRSTTEISFLVDEVEPCRTPVSSSRHARGVTTENTGEREGRVPIGQLESLRFKLTVCASLRRGFTEFLDRLVREEGRYYFDEPSFTSETLF